MKYRWVWRRSEKDRVAAEQLSRELKISRTVAELLCSRGVRSADDADQFLSPKLHHLHDPYLMAGMREAVARIMRAIASGETILIYGDYDVDGVTSIVILKKTLEMLGAKVLYHVPERLRDGYGMKTDAIARFASGVERVRLVISVDCGIRAHAVVDEARALGVDVIVTDHHLPETELPRAVAVLNPKRPDCGYPNKALCGAGVALKLAQALLPQAGRGKALESFLKIAAIGTIADVVPLTGENRVIAKLGLEGLRTPTNHGLRALLEAAGLDSHKPITGHDVGFRIAPRINAVGRMGEASPAIDLFWTASLEDARRIAGELNEHNTRRQQTEAAVVKEILEMLDADAALRAMKVLVLAHDGWHRGVIGIAASKIVDRYHRPTIVVALDDGVGHGSGRSIGAFHLLDGLDTCADLFERYGGHSHAAGLVIRRERVDEFRRRINAHADQVLGDKDLVPEAEIDAELSVADVSFDLVREIQSLGPFGPGNPKPLFALREARIAGEPRVLKERHLKFRIMKEPTSIEAIWWNGAEVIQDLRSGDRVSLAFSLEENEYNGLVQVQLTLKDLSVVTGNHREPIHTVELSGVE
jgi:single-stranded-DNA-specific exonuclease